jgi:hypothetical protein
MHSHSASRKSVKNGRSPAMPRLPDTTIERSPRLKLAVGWLAAQTVLGAAFLFVLDLPAESKFVGIIVAVLSSMAFGIFVGGRNIR